MSSSTSKSSVSRIYRAAEIILGIVAIAVGITALFFPLPTMLTIDILFGIALIIIGILKIAAAASPKGPNVSAKSANAIIGVVALIIGLLITFFPVIGALTLIILLGLGLLIWGIGRIVVGGAGSNMNGGLRALLIILGILVAIFGFFVIFVPVLGAFTYAFFVALAFILIGIDSIASGIVGVKII